MTSAPPRPPRRLHAGTLALLAALLLVPAGCGDREGPAAPDGTRRGRYDAAGRLVEGTRARAALPNVVLLVLDTLRADAFHGRDGAPTIMPSLTAWAKAATDFVDASAPAAWTAPSVTTMLTGLQPSDHGVQGHVAASPLVPAVTTLAEILQAAGYATVAFTGGGWVSRAMGLGQGFDQFVEPWNTSDPRKALRRSLAERRGEKPLFLLLHTYEAHDPYGRKEPAEGREDPARVAAADAEVTRLAQAITDRPDALTHEEGRALLLGWRAEPLVREGLTARLTRERAAGAAIWYQWSGHPTDPQRAATEATLRARYELGVAALDAGLGRTLAMIDEADLPGRTVVIVASDHGEAFGEQGALGHGRWLHDPIARTVLLVRAPGQLPAGPVRGACGVVDVTPTILDLVGLPVPVDSAGRSLLAQGRGREGGRPVLAEEFRRRPLDTKVRNEYVTYRVVTVRTERAKLELVWDPRDHQTAEAAFDLVADPAEAHPLPATDLARFGPDFVAAAARARAHVATFPSRADNHGDGRFQGE